MFETASRRKYRYPYKGMITTEDLWTLKVQQLDEVYKALNAKAKLMDEESLLTTKSSEDEDLTNMINIVKHIVAVKVAEANAAKLAIANREQKQRILEIIDAKKNAQLSELSVEELQAMVNKL